MLYSFRIAVLIEEINRLRGEKGVKKRASPRGEPGVGEGYAGEAAGRDGLANDRGDVPPSPYRPKPFLIDFVVSPIFLQA